MRRLQSRVRKHLPCRSPSRSGDDGPAACGTGRMRARRAALRRSRAASRPGSPPRMAGPASGLRSSWEGRSGPGLGLQVPRFRRFLRAAGGYWIAWQTIASKPAAGRGAAPWVSRCQSPRLPGCPSAALDPVPSLPRGGESSMSRQLSGRSQRRTPGASDPFRTQQALIMWAGPTARVGIGHARRSAPVPQDGWRERTRPAAIAHRSSLIVPGEKQKPWQPATACSVEAGPPVCPSPDSGRLGGPASTEAGCGPVGLQVVGIGPIPDALPGAIRRKPRTEQAAGRPPSPLTPNRNHGAGSWQPWSRACPAPSHAEAEHLRHRIPMDPVPASRAVRPAPPSAGPASTGPARAEACAAGGRPVVPQPCPQNLRQRGQALRLGPVFPRKRRASGRSGGRPGPCRAGEVSAAGAWGRRGRAGQGRCPVPPRNDRSATGPAGGGNRRCPPARHGRLPQEGRRRIVGP